MGGRTTTVGAAEDSWIPEPWLFPATEQITKQLRLSFLSWQPMTVYRLCFLSCQPMTCIDFFVVVVMPAYDLYRLCFLFSQPMTCINCFFVMPAYDCVQTRIHLAANTSMSFHPQGGRLSAVFKIEWSAIQKYSQYRAVFQSDSCSFLRLFDRVCLTAGLDSFVSARATTVQARLTQVSKHGV